MTRKTKIIVISGVAIILILVLVPFGCKKKNQGVTFETVTVTKGTVSNTVTATGTIQAIKTVAVGTQVSGVINKLYVDFNSVVKKGQILAELDKTPLLASLDVAQASLDDSKAELTYKESNYKRVKALFDKSLVAQNDYDVALYNYLKAQATAKNAQSNYDKTRINLSYATITSPIDGVVLNRAVDEGQTVAASFNTPTLFSIANDLTQMQVEANIDEADIGQIKLGQKVDFMVDAFTDLKFAGEVTEIRLQPVTSNNVVTYTVIIKAPNPDKKLMPGMTANINIKIEEANDVVLTASKALLFKPDSATVAVYLNSIPENERPKIDNPKGNMPSVLPSQSKEKSGEVWVKENKMIRPVPVVTGVADGSNVEIKSGLKEGDEVIISMVADGNKQKTTSSPFMPKMPQDKKTQAKK
jgi:HlyD family secretion protein